MHRGICAYHLYTLKSEHFCLPYRILHISYKQNMLTNHMVTRLYEGKLERVMGKEDFFFCQWYADSADDIMDSLDKGGYH